jgi:hypothetical protein
MNKCSYVDEYILTSLYVLDNSNGIYAKSPTEIQKGACPKTGAFDAY